MIQTEPHQKRLGIKSCLIISLLLVVVLAVTFLLGTMWRGHSATPSITSDLLGQQLRDINELATVEYHYTNMGKYENQMDFYGWKVPLTTKSFIISYDGLIKAGVDLSQANISVDEAQHTIQVTLPDAEILSHEIPEDSIQIFDETHNIFNPITISDYTGFTRDQKLILEKKAIDNGLLTAASKRAVSAVEALLNPMPGTENYTLSIE